MDTESLLLHVAVETADQGYTTRIVTSPLDRPSAPFVLPMNERELGAFWQAMEEASEPEAIDLEAGRAQATGERLFRALFPEPLETTLRNAMQLAYRQRSVLHLRLTLPDDPTFLTLPWEYLFDPNREEHLTLASHSPMMRYIDRRHQIRPLIVERPLRALVVIAGGAETAEARREWIKLIDTLDYLGMDGRLLIERLERPTLFELQRKLRQQPYHVLHVIGHAVYNETARDGRLVIEDEVGHGRLISGPHLGQVLRDHYATRLVILQSRDETMDRRNPLGLVAHNLVPRGIPAAIVLPYRLPDDLTLAFLHDLYAAVADLRPIDLAMVEARNAMASERPNILWGMPWLLARTVDGRIFDDGSRPARKETLSGRRKPSLLERVLSSNREFDL